MSIHWVATTGNDTTGSGSRDNPYKTIEKALTVFEDKDQIRILDGTYTPVDSVVVSGKEGSIFAENPQAVYIQPQKTTVHRAGVVILDSPRFSIVGVNILQAADSSGNLIGIYAESVQNFICFTCSVQGFVVPSGDAYGIFAAGSGRIKDCDVADLSARDDLYGIRTLGLDVIDCSVTELSGVQGDVWGIYVDGGAS